VRKIIIALVVLMVLIACATKKGLVKYRIIEIEERIPLIDNDPDSINYHIELYFTELTDYPDKNALKRAKKELNKQFFEIEKKEFSLDPVVNFKSMLIDLTQNYRKEGIELKKEYKDMSYMLNYELIKLSKIVCNKNDILIIELETYVYSGGAHGLGNKSYLHFNMKTGNAFDLKTVFIKDFESELNNTLLARCNEKKDDEDFMIFEEASPQANENFYFDDKNFYFVYNPYEVAPYSAGYIIIDIPLETIGKWINKNGPVGFLN